MKPGIITINDGGSAQMRLDMARKIINIIAFQACWWCIVLSAAQDAWLIPPLVMTGYLILHLRWISPGPAEIRFITAGAVLGITVDLLLGITGLLNYKPNALGLSFMPLWLVCLWVGFVSTINCSLGWLRGRLVLASIFGVLGGPGSYWLGAKLGALQFGSAATLPVLIVAWAGIMPALIWISGRIMQDGESKDG